MKKLAKTIVSLSLVVVMIICLCGTALAATSTSTPWSTFPTVTKDTHSNYYYIYSYAIQSFLYYYDNSLRIIINNHGGIDGYYGDGAEAAVYAFQGIEDIETDGKVGSETWNTMYNALRYSHITADNYITFYDIYCKSHETIHYGNYNPVYRLYQPVVGAIITGWYIRNNASSYVKFSN